MAKAHIVSSAEPLQERVPLVAPCGEEITRPKFLASMDMRWIIGNPFLRLQITMTLMLCRKCLRTELPEKCIVYAVIEGTGEGRSDEADQD
jgi:hypothetical protein